jgi:soluble P-type ATPase
MIALDVPGFGALRLHDAVLDFNGTLARDGRLLPGVATRLRTLAARLDLHVVTADTTGTAARALAKLPVELRILGASRQAAAKAAFVRKLGAGRVVAVGNGRNDAAMLARAALGIAVCGAEGCAADALAAARVMCLDIRDALDLLLMPLRLVATLRA